MKTLWILGNQLNKELEGFRKIDPREDVILLIESRERSQWRKVHKQKLVLIFSAMRHFAEELRKSGYSVDYRKAQNFTEGLKEHFEDYDSTVCLIHEPTDYFIRNLFKQKIRFEILSEKPLFIVEKKQWEKYLPKERPWKQEKVYQRLRKEQNILMDEERPIGGKWSYDTENRKPPKEGLRFEEPLKFPPDEITRAVIEKVKQEYPEHFGEMEDFSWPVTRENGLRTLDHFIDQRLKTFGDYQDAMMTEDPWMSHSLLSGVINTGLIAPREVIEKAETAYHEGKAPLSSVEGFIRQVLGWREYIRGVYLQSMPEYEKQNYFDHQNPLPAYYWTGKTDMHCVSTAVKEVIGNGYNHHIQRLMVLGNWANLLRVKPQEVSNWFLEAYVDAYDWVVLPNVLGMALYADGGLMSTKPYVSSGKYIQRMSNYCKSCKYNINDKTGDQACPFHALYWTFLEDHRDLLENNPRMRLMYANWDRQKSAQKGAILKKGRELLG